MIEGWNVGRASMAEAQRIAKLATTQGGHYLEDLWALVEYATDDRVRAFAYAEATEVHREQTRRAPTIRVLHTLKRADAETA